MRVWIFTARTAHINARKLVEPELARLQVTMLSREDKSGFDPVRTQCTGYGP